MHEACVRTAGTDVFAGIKAGRLKVNDHFDDHIGHTHTRNHSPRTGAVSWSLELSDERWRETICEVEAPDGTHPCASSSPSEVLRRWWWK
jgi:hypothetical protein